MTQQEYNLIINAGQTLDISPELMATARAHAHQLRSEAALEGGRTLSTAIGSAFRKTVAAIDCRLHRTSCAA